MQEKRLQASQQKTCSMGTVLFLPRVHLLLEFQEKLQDIGRQGGSTGILLSHGVGYLSQLSKCAEMAFLYPGHLHLYCQGTTSQIQQWLVCSLILALVIPGRK